MLDGTRSRYCHLLELANAMDIPYLSLTGRSCYALAKSAQFLTLVPSSDHYLWAGVSAALDSDPKQAVEYAAIFYDSTFRMYSCLNSMLCYRALGLYNTIR